MDSVYSWPVIKIAANNLSAYRYRNWDLGKHSFVIHSRRKVIRSMCFYQIKSVNPNLYQTFLKSNNV